MTVNYGHEKLKFRRAGADPRASANIKGRAGRTVGMAPFVQRLSAGPPPPSELRAKTQIVDVQHFTTFPAFLAFFFRGEGVSAAGATFAWNMCGFPPLNCLPSK